MGRLAGLDAGLHQLHVRLHALDTRVVELTRGLRQLREAAGDTRDAVQALQEAQSRTEREHGRLEGESAPRRAGWESGSTRLGWGYGGRRGPERWGVPVSGGGGSWRFGECRRTGRVDAGSLRAVGETRWAPRGGADPTPAAPRPLQAHPDGLAPPPAALELRLPAVLTTPPRL